MRSEYEKDSPEFKGKVRTGRFAAALVMLLILSSCGLPANKANVDNGAFIAISAPAAENISSVDTSAENVESSGTDNPMNKYDFKGLKNVTISGIDLSSLNDAELAILYAQARYCQAMTDTDIDTMRSLVSEDKVYIHMSGMKQTREEYFADIADGSLCYYMIGIADPVIKVSGERGNITYISVLNASAYGARGTYRMKGTHYYELRKGSWIEVNKD